MSSNALFWSRLAARLPGRRVLALDLRGHGHSEKPDGGYTTEAMAKDVARAIVTLGLERPVVVGHSWGAAVALELAGRDPELLSALALLDGPNASLAKRMTLAEADREMRPPSMCYSDVERRRRTRPGSCRMRGEMTSGPSSGGADED